MKRTLLALTAALALALPQGAKAVQIDPGLIEFAYVAVKEALCAAGVTCFLPDDMLLPYPTPSPDDFWQIFYRGSSDLVVSGWYDKPLVVPIEALKRMYEATGTVPPITIVYPEGEREIFWQKLDWVRREPVCDNIKLVESGQTDISAYAYLKAEWVPLLLYNTNILIGWQLGDRSGWLIPVGPTARFWTETAIIVLKVADAGIANKNATEDPKDKFIDPEAEPHPEAPVEPAEEFCIEEEDQT